MADAQAAAAAAFQFHYGTIKSSTPLPYVSLKSNFNSTMVRLKDVDWMTGAGDTEYFNSTMVRLKEYCRPYVRCFYVISIPLWYD